MKSKPLHTFILASIAFLYLFILPTGSFAQTKGLIFKPAINGGQRVVDPNGDNFVSKTTAGFPLGNGVYMDEGPDYSEVPYKPFPLFMDEPLSDLSTGGSGGHTDFAPKQYDSTGKPVGSPAASHFDGANLMFRFRLGGESSASKGYSVLIDSDNTMNNYSATNPGFEYEVLLSTNFDVSVIRHTPSGSAITIWSGAVDQYFQKAIAGSMGNNDPDYFYDFYAPLSAFGGGITESTPLRFAANTVTSAKQSALYGVVSDVGSINDLLYNDKVSAWEDLLATFPATTPNEIGTVGFPPVKAMPPYVYGPIIKTTGTVNINGSSVERAGSVITVFQNGVQIGTTTVQANGTWTLPVDGSILVVDRMIDATVKPTDKTVSDLSNRVKVQLFPCTVTPPTVVSVTSGGKGITGTTNVTGTLRIYSITGTNSTPVLQAEFPVTAGVSWSKELSGTGNSLPTATYWATIQAPGNCESDPSNQICIVSGTGSTQGSVSPTPSITPTSNITTTSASITVTAVNAGSTLIIYKNGGEITRATLGSLEKSRLFSLSNLVNGDRLYARAIDPSNSSTCPALSGISNPVDVVIPLPVSAAPVITGTYCGTTTAINGTSTENPGTVIRLYSGTTTTTLLGSTTVNAFGSWSITGLNLAPGATVTARALATDKTLSVASNTVTISSILSISGYTVNSPIYDGALRITGTAPSSVPAGTEARLYIGGSPTNYRTSTFTSGTWFMDVMPLDIYAGAEIYIRVATTGSTCESAISNTVIVQCDPMVKNIIATLSAPKYCYGTSATVNLSSTEYGAIYSLYLGTSSTQTGASIVGNGRAMSLQSGPLTANPTSLRVVETQTGSVCADRTVATLSAELFDPVPNNYSLTASPSSGCANLSSVITVASANVAYSYQLINASTKETLSAAITPTTNGNLSFPAITVPSTTTYSVIIRSIADGCSAENQSTVTVTITGGPDVSRAVTAPSQICEGSSATITVAAQAGYTYSVFDKSTNQQIGTSLVALVNANMSVTTGALSPGTKTYYVRVAATVANGCPATTLTNEATVTVLTTGTIPTSAGSDRTICSNSATASVTLEGSDPAPGTGAWTVVSRPTGSASPTFSSTTSRTPTVSGLVSGDYVFRWTVTTSCGSGFSDVKITVNCAASYSMGRTDYFDSYLDGEKLATAYDKDGGVSSASVVAGTLPFGSRLVSNGDIVVDNSIGILEAGNFFFSIRTVDAFDVATVNNIALAILPRGAAIAPLRVQLTHFTAVSNKNKVTLQWHTASEENNDRFEVERSTDARNFTKIGTIQGKGSSTQLSQYSFQDMSPLSGTAYYRLKQTDYDGKFGYSNMIAVNFKGIENRLQVQVYPNPFPDQLNVAVMVQEAGQTELQVQNLQGRVILRKSLSLEKGLNTVELQLKDLASGIYLLKVTGSNMEATTKIVKTTK